MVREIMMHEGNIGPADCKATAAVSTGMGVVIDRAAKTFSLPEAETAENIYVVHKTRIPEGAYAGVANLSDYFEQFNHVAEGEYAVLVPYAFGAVFATSEYAEALTEGDAGKRVAVGTDGKWAVAGTASKYLFNGWYNDNGHQLAKIEVCDSAASN